MSETISATIFRRITSLTFKKAGFTAGLGITSDGNEDPRLKGKHPELKDKVIVPDVLLEPHNASLELTFYGAQQFPEKYRGGIFAAEHGSWNRSVRTGYEVVFVPTHKTARLAGSIEDFVHRFRHARRKSVGQTGGSCGGERWLVNGHAMTARTQSGESAMRANRKTHIARR